MYMAIAFTLSVIIICIRAMTVFAAPACPNEAIREEQGATSLPDCRAYEMVTPPYKEGFRVFPLSTASNGEHVILGTFADLAGSIGSGEYPLESNVYLAERTAEGWGLSPLNASNSEYSGQVLLAREADDGETLWLQHEASQSASHAELWGRSASGKYRLIGPDKPTETYEEEQSNATDLNPARLANAAAATHDFTHVVLRAEQYAAHWEFDHTAESAEGEPFFRSLYEYSGLGNREPILVGVTGTKGSTQLLAECGAVLGSGGGGSAYNALSADGEMIFFTVRPCAHSKAEVYARIHGAVASPLPAKTVHVSASECTVACSGEESGKNFEGASENGSRVYFTSTQKLTNEAADGVATGNAAQGACAGEGSDCNLYEYNTTSERLTAIAPNVEVLGVMGIAEDGSRVYYVSRAELHSVGSNPYGKLPLAGQPNIYVYYANSGQTAFVSTLSNTDSPDWQRLFARPVEIADSSGRFLLFASDTPSVTPDDSSAAEQLFEYKAEGEGEPAELVRVSKGEAGYNEDGNGVSTGLPTEPIENIAQALGRNRDFKQSANRLNVSRNGRTVVFVTAGQLSPRAVSVEQGCTSVYEFHAPGEVLTDGSVSLISDGHDVLAAGGPGSPCGSDFFEMDATGANILFHTADPLLRSDLDGFQTDVYDARVNGGFANGSPSSCPQVGSCENPGGNSVANSPPPTSSWLTPEADASGSVVGGTGASQKPGSSTRSAKSSCKKRLGGRRRVMCERKARQTHKTANKKGTRR